MLVKEELDRKELGEQAVTKNSSVAKTSLIAVSSYFFKAFCLFEIAFLVGAGNILAQTLDLFEEIEINDEADRRRRENGPGSESNAIGPEFVLVGTSRFGARYAAFLKDREGVTRVVNSGEGVRRAFIPGHSRFELLEVKATEVSVRYPEEVPCVEFLERGIRCAAPDEAILTLINSKPLQSLGGVGLESVAGDKNGQNQEGDPVNPFAALLEQSANTDANESNSFVPQRIRAEDIPPGMRVVSTPFGDRLVEE
ncbi:MAG: hypothetical protein P8K27_02155 [Gammaproteobacteria bacterium]|nr:hypothetical protein [Gammaproteobacteria bacterium]